MTQERAFECTCFGDDDEGHLPSCLIANGWELVSPERLSAALLDGRRLREAREQIASRAADKRNEEAATEWDERYANKCAAIAFEEAVEIIDAALSASSTEGTDNG